MRDRISSYIEVVERVGVESMDEWLWGQRLRWFRHVLRRGKDTEVRKVLTIEVAGTSMI